MPHGRLLLLALFAISSAGVLLWSTGVDTPVVGDESPPPDGGRRFWGIARHSPGIDPESVQPTAQLGSTSTSAPAVAVPEAPNVSCFEGPSFPLSPLEEELRRLYDLTDDVMSELNVTYWPADATLLGLMRNGRVVTDRDLDFQVHSTFDGCHRLLSSFRDAFARRATLKSFKVAKVKLNGRKIGRYAMVRMYRQFGTFDTGPDFNCVYTDGPGGPAFFTHKGALTRVPDVVFPLGWCSAYGKVRRCPRDGMAFLATLTPRYDGCMAFPHCLGDPEVSVRECMSPHPDRPLAEFPEVIDRLDRCGFTSLKSHFANHPACPLILSGQGKRCRQLGGTKICFLQEFAG